MLTIRRMHLYTSVYIFLLIFEVAHKANSQIYGASERIDCIDTIDNSISTRTCFDAFSDQTNWTDAWARCAAHGGQLARLTTPEINGLIGAYMDRITAGLEDDFAVWIGGYERNASNWQWISGREFHYDRNNTSATVVNLTSLVKPFETCAVVSSNGTSGLVFQSLQCRGAAAFVCQNGYNSNSAPTTCHVGSYSGVIHGNSCYATVSLSNPVTWFQARYECIKNGGDLAVFDESRDHDVIVSLLPAGSQMAFWIGLWRYPWIWAKNYNPVTQTVDQWQDMTFTQWDSMSPNYNGKNCLAMNGHGGAGHEWVNARCNETHAYICQQISVTTTTVGFIYIDVNLTDTSSGDSFSRDKIVNIVVPCAIVAAIFIIIGFTIYCYFSKRKHDYEHH